MIEVNEFFTYLAIGVVIYILIEDKIFNPTDYLDDDDKYGGK